jgi:hypothetical protein
LCPALVDRYEGEVAAAALCSDKLELGDSFSIANDPSGLAAADIDGSAGTVFY